MFSPSDISPSSSPMQTPDSEGTLNRNISKILSLLDTPSSNKRRSGVEETNTPNPKLKNLLQDVIAYVEVRSKFENRGKAIAQQLRHLGATVVQKFTNEVTHVIFKEGKKSTRDKANKKGIHLISVLWIEACKENEQHMPEKDYPANIKEESAMPFAVTRLKRCKSMQPKDFDEELANSAEKVERRRKMREKKEKLKILGTPVTPLQFNRNQFYVTETQPMSPVFLSPSISVPETPPSMRRKLELLRRKKGIKDGTNLDGSTSDLMGSLQESPPCGPSSPLQKKLFGSTSASPSCSTNSSIGVTPLTADNIPEVRGSVLDDRDLSQPVKREGLFDSILEDPSENMQRRRSMKLPQISSTGSSTSSGRSSETIMGSSTNSTASVLPTKRTNEERVSPTAKTSSGTSTKSKGGKRKLMTLDEGPVEKLLSPANTVRSSHSKSGILDFPEPKKGIAKNSTLEGGSKSRKRKTGEANLSDSNSSDNESNKKSRKKTKSNVKKCTDSDSGSPKSSTADKKTKRSPKPTNAKTKRRSVAVTTPSQPTRTSRRRSCMPAISTPSSLLKQKVSFTAADNTASTADSSEYVPRLLEVDTPAKPTETYHPEISHGTKNCSASSRSSDIDVTEANQKKTSDVNPRRSSRRSCVVHSSKLKPVFEVPRDTNNFLPDTSEVLVKKPKKSASTCTMTGNTSAIQEEEISIAGQSYMSVAYSALAAPDSSVLKPSRRRSTQEFVLSDIRKLKKKTISMSSAIDTSSSDEDDKTERKPAKLPLKLTSRSKKAKKRLERKSSDSGSDISCCSNASVGDKKAAKSNPSKTLVMTSLHFSEQDCVRAVVKKFGDFVVEDTVSPRTTHVVCGNDRRTINILLAISQGCWIVSLQWVLKSLEAGHWLNESDFELKDIFPAARKSRQDRMSCSAEYKSSLFSKQGLIYVAGHTAPPHQDLVRLLKLCGGQVTHCARKASVCVGSNQKSANTAVSVSEKWILDSITSHKELPYDEYKI